MTTADNHLVSFLIMTGAVAQSELTPWRTRRLTRTVTTTVTTTVWVITSVHYDTTDGWADTLAAGTTSGTNLDVLMLNVAYSTNICTTASENLAHFAGWHAKQWNFHLPSSDL